MGSGDPVEENFPEIMKHARERLGFVGEVRLKLVSPADNPLKLGPIDARTGSSKDSSRHEIRVLEDSYVNNAILFHEFSHVKLNEAGFKRVELKFIEETKELRSSTATEKASEDSLFVIAECYADAILHSGFWAETFLQRGQIISDYSQPEEIKKAAADGFIGMGKLAAYRRSLTLAGRTSSDSSLETAALTNLGPEDAETYKWIHGKLGEAPAILHGGEVKQLSDSEVDLLVEIAKEMLTRITARKKNEASPE